MMSDVTTWNLRALRLSLAFVWLTTAAVSVLGRDTHGLNLLHEAGLYNPDLNRFLILGGAFLDSILGLAFIIRPTSALYKISLGVMVIMTAIATVLLPTLWLHPLGPLTKNVPIAIALIILIKAENEPVSDT